MTDKQGMTLEGVPRTLLIPLIGRAKYSNYSFSPVKDQLAVELVEQFDYDFAELVSHLGPVPLFMMARAVHFDRAIEGYCQMLQSQSGSNVTIVNLGAGLDTTFYRINNPTLQWIDLDVPEVMTLRTSLLPQSKQIHSIAKSIFDYSWMDDIKKIDQQFFFFAGGLFMYFTEAQVKDLFKEMAKQFPNSELIFDTIPKRGLFYANRMLIKSKMSGAEMHWGIDDALEMELWSDQIQIKDHCSYFKDIKNRKGIPLGLRLKMYFYDLGSNSSITHVRFTS